MIRFDADDLISLPEAARSLPGKVNPATLWRWCSTGRYGYKLPSLLLGRSRYTTRAMLQKFLVESDPLLNDPPAPAKPRRKSEAERFCKQEGI